MVASRGAGGMFNVSQLPYFATAACLMALQPLLVALSRDSEGGFTYSVPCSTMLSELLKLLISVVLLIHERFRAPAGAPPVMSQEAPICEFFAYMVPGLIYFINNNCQFFILQAIDPTTFQLLSQLKTVFTGLLFRLVLQRKLQVVQWLALVTLSCGTAVSQLHLVSHDDSADNRPREALPAFVGLLLCVVTSIGSALAGIYNEKLMKDRQSTTLHWQNLQLYTWGVGFNAIGLFMKDGDAVRHHGLLGGFTALAYVVVVCNAFVGLSISAVLKYADNIARVYAHAIAMMLTMAVSVKLLGVPVTPQLCISVVLVASSTLQYNLPPSVLAAPEVASNEERNEKDCLLHVGESDNVRVAAPASA
mmetsp:Transcript_83817/g.233807  ORF Transcript_83817/g.233807 Transcript_83817/m.233807 type:complete len:363 (-) Transcript_83817:138-1226(-)